MTHPSSTPLFLPYRLVPNWLDAGTADELLRFAARNEASFERSEIRRKDHAPGYSDDRISQVTSDLGGFAAMLRARALETAPMLMQAFGTGLFTPESVEIELAAHGDGALFKPHTDTATGASTARSPRQISMVYYLHSQPKRFTGGQLRYYAMGQSAFIDIEPGHGLLLAFPSIAPHAVQRVFCPGVPFADWRFAVNIWVHGDRITRP